MIVGLQNCLEKEIVPSDCVSSKAVVHVEECPGSVKHDVVLNCILASHRAEHCARLLIVQA